MAWWHVAAAAAAPMVAGMFTKRPSVPGYMGRQEFMTPEEEKYYKEFLASAFSPQSELQRLAQESANTQVMANLSRSGLAGSSLGLQAQRAMAADLANKFLERELERRKMGLNAMYDKGKIELGVGQDMRSAAMDKYKDDFNQAQNFVRGIGGIAKIGMDYYGRSQVADQLADNEQAIREAMMNQRGMTYQMPAAYYGVPGEMVG